MRELGAVAAEARAQAQAAAREAGPALQQAKQTEAQVSPSFYGPAPAAERLRQDRKSGTQEAAVRPRRAPRLRAPTQAAPDQDRLMGWSCQICRLGRMRLHSAVSVPGGKKQLSIVHP